jgi:hypothetical protein
MYAGSAAAVMMMAAAMHAAPAAAAATAASKPSKCVTQAEMTALAGRVLETELLVGALSCSQAPQYNAFMEKFRKPQHERARTLQAMFARMYGKGAQREMDAFVTRLGNDSALRSLELQIAYCQSTWDLFEEASTVSEADYDRLAGKPWIVGRHKYQACASGDDSAKPAKKKG